MHIYACVRADDRHTIIIIISTCIIISVHIVRIRKLKEMEANGVQSEIRPQAGQRSRQQSSNSPKLGEQMIE